MTQDFDEIIDQAAALIGDGYYRLKAAAITAGAARKITLVEAAALVLKLAQTGLPLREIEAQCQVSAERARR